MLEQFFKDSEFFIRTQPMPRNMSWLDEWLGMLHPEDRKRLDEAAIEFVKKEERRFKESGMDKIDPIQVPKNMAHDIANLHFKT